MKQLVRYTLNMNSAYNTYNVKVTDPSPSMNQTIEVFTAATYKEAVAYAQAKFLKLRRSTVLCSGEYGMYYWHRIAQNGITEDRNTNSGVPATENLLAEVGR
jgi:hypothetical protein